jgi:hypothetical protein
VYHIVTPRIKNPIPIGQPFQLRKLSAGSRILEEPSYYQQDSARGGHKSTDDTTGKQRSDESSTRKEEREFERIFQRLDTYNQAAIRLGLRLAHQQEQSKAQLLGALDSETLSSLLKVTLNRYAKLYGVADALAIYFRDRSVKMLFWLFWLASQRLKDSLEQGKPQDAERVMRELGEEALTENGDWVMLHRTMSNRTISFSY